MSGFGDFDFSNISLPDLPSVGDVVDGATHVLQTVGSALIPDSAYDLDFGDDGDTKHVPVRSRICPRPMQISTAASFVVGAVSQLVFSSPALYVHEVMQDIKPNYSDVAVDGVISFAALALTAFVTTMPGTLKRLPALAGIAVAAAGGFGIHYHQNINAKAHALFAPHSHSTQAVSLPERQPFIAPQSKQVTATL